MEVKVWIGENTVPCTVIIPVNESKYKSLQSVRTHSRPDIELCYFKKQFSEAEEIIKKVKSKYQELVEPSLKAIFGDIPIKYTEANTMMIFSDKNGEEYQAVFLLNKKETAEEKAE